MHDVSTKWRKLLGLLPGYDPFRDAGDCRFDEALADKRCEFFHDCLHHVEGAKSGEPFDLEDWQKAVVGNLFGWLRPDETRRYRDCLLFVPRKNGKTPFSAGILNLVLFCDKEPGAQIYGAAGDREQAALLFRHASGMVHMDDDLDALGVVYESYKSICLRKDRLSSYKVLSAEAGTKHGKNSSFVVIDELHVQPNRDLYDTLRTSFASKNRKQPLFLNITTAGWDRHSVCYEVYEYACKVRDGIIKDATFLPVIYEAGPKDDWKDEATWWKANPNLDVSVDLDYMRRECQRAIDIPRYENTFRRLQLNSWVEQATRWLPMDKWDGCGTQDIDLSGEICFAGLDLSSSRDITALVLDFPREDGTHIWRAWFWVPGESARRREREDRVPYPQWAKDGLIESTEGDVVDYSRIRAKLNELREQYQIQSVGCDPWNATQIMTDLQADGFECVKVRQNFATLSSPSKELEKLVVSGKLGHGNNPVLRWMASNVSADMDAHGNLKPNKSKSSERIDGIVAGIMALGVAMVTWTGSSVYDERGAILI